MDRKHASQMIDEMRLFASFSAAEQRFVRRSLDVGLNRCDPIKIWARDAAEAVRIRAQERRYGAVELIRVRISDNDGGDAADSFLLPLITMSLGDLAEGMLSGFEPYRFLYERLIGPEVRPWLLCAFCTAAAMPAVHPQLRRKLMEAIPLQAVTAAGWSLRLPLFYPEWVEKVAEAVS